MRILVTNDDGYDAKGLLTLVRILRGYGDVTVVAPKRPQSGMSMAVTMGFKPIAVKHLSEKEGGTGGIWTGRRPAASSSASTMSWRRRVRTSW